LSFLEGLAHRRQRGGMFYIEDTHTRKRESLGTKIRAEATALPHARNESIRQPQLNLQIAKAYLAGTDSGVSTRTWQDAFNAIIENKAGTTKERWQRGVRQKAFDLIHHQAIVETQAEHLFACLKAGTVSTNILLREPHNFCISMNWLAWPIIPNRLWPRIEYRPKRAITADEHRMIVERQRNLKLRALYGLCWHVGGSQTDIANLAPENIDWSARLLLAGASFPAVPQWALERSRAADSGAHIRVDRVGFPPALSSDSRAEQRKSRFRTAGATLFGFSSVSQ
jgi:hypothetical protein